MNDGTLFMSEHWSPIRDGSLSKPSISDIFQNRLNEISPLKNPLKKNHRTSNVMPIMCPCLRIYNIHD